MRTYAASAAVVLLAVVLFGCAVQTSVDSPEGVVRDYVQARASGDAAAANAMLTEYARQHRPVPATAQVPGIEDLTVGESRPVSMDGVAYDHWEGYAQVRTATATYRTPDTADTKNIQTSEPVIVVKERPASPWRIEMDRASE